MGGGGFQSGGGLFGNILGPNVLGLTGGGSSSTQSTELDPTTQALNDFRLRQLQGAGFNAGDLFGRPNYAYNLSPQAQNLSGQMQAFGSNPGQWYNQTWGMLNPGDTQNQLAALSGQNQANLEGNLQNQLGYGQGSLEGALQNYLGTGQSNLQNTLSNYLSTGRNDLQSSLNNYLNANQNQAGSVLNQQLGYINNQMRPEMTAAGNQYYQNILGPQVGNQYALMGLARSGGRQEAEGKAAASVALPIEQQLAGLSGQALGQYGSSLNTGLNAAYGQYGSGLQNLVNQAYGQYGQGQQNLTNQAYGQYGQGLQNLNSAAYGAYNQGTQQNQQQNYGAQAGLGTNALQNLYGLNMAYPSTGSGLLSNAFSASDYQRALQQQGFQNQQQAFLSAFNSTPYTAAPTISQQGTKNEGLLDTALAGGVGAGIGSAIGKSDRRSKTNIDDFDSGEFLDQLHAYQYQYIDAADSDQRQAGIMAQDLEKTELGQQFVLNRAEGKFIQFSPGLLNLMLACIVDQNRRIRELEHATE